MLEWSKAVNKTVHDIVHNLPPFPKVRECLAKLRERADILVVSATPQEALDREWAEHSIDKYVAFIAGQEMGSKTEHLSLAAKGKYPSENILMVGDAPGDFKAARDVSALFYPVNPGDEEASWERFHDEAIDKFFGKQYGGAYESKLLTEFDRLLPKDFPGSPDMSDSSQANIGMVGLAVMGRNLALNIADHGYRVGVWNLEGDVTDKFVAEYGTEKFVATKSLAELVSVLEQPRRLWVMIKAGKPVDEVLNQLKPLLDPGDVVIDGGNTHFEETRRREADLKQKGIRFVGMGVSGGEEGARRGPSLMPGGDKDAWESLKPILESIAAKTDSGAVRDPRRSRRRGPLREDGPQRHRIRRHAADRRGLRHARPGAGAVGAGDRRTSSPGGTRGRWPRS